MGFWVDKLVSFDSVSSGSWQHGALADHTCGIDHIYVEEVQHWTVHPESLVVSAVEANEVQHKTALVLEQVGDEHCVGSRLDVSEQADSRMGQHLEYA